MISSFLQMDSYEGSASDPLSLNKYLYAGASPTIASDPTGHLGVGDEGRQRPSAPVSTRPSFRPSARRLSQGRLALWGSSGSYESLTTIFLLAIFWWGLGDTYPALHRPSGGPSNPTDPPEEPGRVPLLKAPAPTYTVGNGIAIARNPVKEVQTGWPVANFEDNGASRRQPGLYFSTTWGVANKYRGIYHFGIQMVSFTDADFTAMYESGILQTDALQAKKL